MEIRNFKWRLGHIVEAIEIIQDRLENTEKDDFVKNYDLQCVIVRQFEIIGEAIGSIDEEVLMKYREVDWYKAKGMRNVIIHQYFDINLDVVWDMAKEDIPVLKKQIEKILCEL